MTKQRCTEQPLPRINRVYCDVTRVRDADYRSPAIVAWAQGTRTRFNGPTDGMSDKVFQFGCLRYLNSHIKP